MAHNNLEIKFAPSKLHFPKIPPHQSIGSFLTSKQHYDPKSISFQFDKPRHDPYCHLVASSRIFDHTKKLLETRREVAKKQRVELDKQWQELHDNEEKFKETFISMTDFLTVNHEKRTRARARILEDTKIREERVKKVEAIKEKIADMKKFEEEIVEETGKLQIFKNYLLVATEKSVIHKRPDEFIERYEDLLYTKQFLAERQEAFLVELENLRNITCKTMESNGFALVGLHNVIADLRSRYLHAHIKALRSEYIVDNIRNFMYKKCNEINIVKMACWNLYKTMCTRKMESPTIEEEDFEAQLTYIKKTLQELGTIIRITKKKKN